MSHLRKRWEKYYGHLQERWEQVLRWFARAMKRIMAICKRDGNKYYVDLQERWKGKVLNPFAIAMEKGIVSTFTRHICRIIEIMETSHLQSYGKMSCHVMFISLHVTFAVMGKWNNKASNLWSATEGKMKSHLWTNWSGMKSLYLCLCLYYYLYLYFQEGGGNFGFWGGKKKKLCHILVVLDVW